MEVRTRRSEGTTQIHQNGLEPLGASACNEAGRGGMGEARGRSKDEGASRRSLSDESVEKGIVNFSGETGIDFVAIGTHQRSGLSRLFKHSISEDIVNHVWQPILTFPV